jgi:hypothetical protein
MQSFIEMLEENKDYLPAVLGMSTGFMIEKAQVLHTPLPLLPNGILTQIYTFGIK